ncbi:MAG: hypothetical protein V4543_01890 [Bacteroidota bacterium]
MYKTFCLYILLLTVCSGCIGFAHYRPNHAELAHRMPVKEEFLLEFDSRFENAAEEVLQYTDRSSNTSFYFYDFYSGLFFKRLPGFNSADCSVHVNFPSAKRARFRFYKDSLLILDTIFKGKLVEKGYAFRLRNSKFQYFGLPIIFENQSHKRTYLVFDINRGLVLHYAGYGIAHIFLFMADITIHKAYLFREIPKTIVKDSLR